MAIDCPRRATGRFKASTVYTGDTPSCDPASCNPGWAESTPPQRLWQDWKRIICLREARGTEWGQCWLSPLILPSHEILSESEMDWKSQRNGQECLNHSQPQAWPRNMGIGHSGRGVSLWAGSLEPRVRLTPPSASLTGTEPP